ncbi:hypothetical protein FRC02_007568 [Tulasnella sp. 418]|nr:hypothetical protein FRC02_007568 [Tulasnella sp. 418]
MNQNNVFSGKNSLLDYYNPDKNPPTPLVEIPEHPFSADGVRIYAKLMSFLPATNIKSLPALNMLQDAQEDGRLNSKTKEVIEYSSGNTVISLAILGRIMGIPNVRALISNKTTDEKIKLLRFFGLDLTLYPGPSQPQPFDPLGGIRDAVELGKQPDTFTPNQYDNDMNYRAHMRWTGPQIIQQLPDISALACAVGTSGSMTGTGLYLKQQKPGTVIVGVCTAQGDRVPGPRTLELLQPVEFPWRESADCVEEIASPESFAMAMDLCRMGILCGPSSGLALCGLYSFLKRMKEEGKLDSLRNDQGEIPAVFLCMDGPLQYMSEFFDKIPESLLKPIRNSELLTVDTYPYLPAWEISPEQADEILLGSPSPESTRLPIVIIDIRRRSDSTTLPLTIRQRSGTSSTASILDLDIGAYPTDPNPFLDPSTMVSQWNALDKRLHNPADPVFGDHKLKGKMVICVCYSGGTARAAAPILRHRGLETYNVIGGLEEWCRSSRVIGIGRNQSNVKDSPVLAKL